MITRAPASRRAFSSRRSGLQADVLALYREALRLARRKEREANDASGQTYAHARERFRASAASVRRMDFQRIEFLLRQGRKQIDPLGMDGARGAVGVRVPSGSAGKS